jgi:hypothetical protein
MITFLFILAETSSYIALLILLFFKLKKAASLRVFALFSVIIFPLLYIAAELFNQLHIILRDHKIYVELGHASITSLAILFLSFIVAICLIIIMMIRRFLIKN